MRPFQNWRVLITGFNDGYTNMAVDEAILRTYTQGSSPPTLRIYGWQPWGFSLGCFQNPDQELDLDECRRFSLRFVRRLTGGSIVFHNQELTYSIVCSRKHFKCGPSVENSFKRICSFIIKTYQNLGLKASFAIDQNRAKKDLGQKTALCFSSREKYDILINDKKIGGNAQRRFNDVVFQHGFIPLEINLDFANSFLKEKPWDLENNITSLSQALGRPMAFEELAFKIRESFNQVNSLQLTEGGLSAEEKELARYLEKEKYSTPDWNVFQRGLQINESCLKQALVA